MHQVLRKKIDEDVLRGERLFASGQYKDAFSVFEDVHVLGQKSIYYHTLAHYWMLKIGIKKVDLREITGQLIRLPFGIIGSAIGFVPTGNSGGANINAFKKMPIRKELQFFMDEDSD